MKPKCDARREEKRLGIILPADDRMRVCGCADCVRRKVDTDRLWDVIGFEQRKPLNGG